MDLKPLVVAFWCFFALSSAGCDKSLRKTSQTQEEPWQNVLAAEIRLSGTEGRIEEQLSRLLDQAGAVPSVEEVAISNVLPGAALRRKNLYKIQREDSPRPDATASLVQSVSPRYFATLELRLILGRLFSAGDSESSASVAIVSETYAKRVWPNENPLGRRLNLHHDGPWSTLVGVVRDGPKAEGMPEVYVPYAQHGFQGRATPVFWYVLARAAGDPKAVGAALQQAVGQEFRSLKEWLESRGPKQPLEG
jgi:hypothetical protein